MINGRITGKALASVNRRPARVYGYREHNGLGVTGSELGA